MLWTAILLGLAATAAEPTQDSGTPSSYWVFVGTYTDGGASRGIYRLELEAQTGKVTPHGVAAESVSPSFLAVHPNRRFLYAVNEVGSFGGKPGGAVSAFALDAARGTLRALNQQSSVGSGPCHIVVDRQGTNVLVANYGGGSVAVLPIVEGGRLAPASASVQHKGSSVDRSRQEGPHAHSINVDAGNRFAVAADLGLDEILVYRFDAAKGSLKPNDPPFTKVASGAGPRHFSFHPDGKHAYVINEMLLTVTAFDYDPQRGTLKEIQTISTVPEGVDRKGLSTAEVQVHPSGNFLYGSNRGHNTIAMFSIDPQTGRLTAIGHQSTGGKTPRNFGIDPSGRFLLAANQDSDTIVVFRINTNTGRLEPTGQTVEVPKPVCVKFVPKG
jgi:6-phosphogluconolactonase